MTTEKEVKAYHPKPLPVLLKGTTDIDWIVDPFIPPQGSALLAGRSGSGKTWLGLDIALSVATGDPWLGRFPVRQGKVLIVDEENAELLLRVRLQKLLRGRGIEGSNPPVSFLMNECINLSPSRNGDKTDFSESYRKLGATIANLKPRLVIFDSMTRIHRANENSANEIAQVFNGLKLYQERLGTSVLMIHHFRKSGSSISGQRIRGSGDIRAFFDTTMLVDQTGGGCKLEHDKPRWSEKLDPFVINFTNHDDEAFTITWGGDKADSDELGIVKQQTWTAIREAFKDTEFVRRQDLREATQGVCSPRYLDQTLTEGVDQGILEKDKDPEDRRQTIYLLADDGSVDTCTALP